MERAERLDRDHEAEKHRGAAEPAVPRSTPLTLVSAAVAGDDLAGVASSAATALGRPVAIAIPSLGEPVTRPEGALSREALQALAAHASAVVSRTAAAEL